MKRSFSCYLLMLICLTVSLGALAEGYIWVIPPQFDAVSEFSEGLAAVEIDEKWGFIDKTGKIVVPPKYCDVFGGDVYGFMDAGGFRDGLAKVQVGDWETGKWGFIDKTGKEVVPCKYDAVSSFFEGMAPIMVHDGETYKLGFIDTTGKEVVPPQYDEVGNFYDGLAMVCTGDGLRGDPGIVYGGKWGFVDKTGKEVVPIEYDKVGRFREGRASVLKDGLLGFVDETGAIVIPLTYETDWPPSLAWHLDVMPFFSEGLAAVWDGDVESGPYGYIDKDGNVVIPFEYDYAAPFSEGLAYVVKGGFCHVYGPDEELGKFGFIDKTGEVVVPLIYDCDYPDHGVLYDQHFHDGFAKVSQEISSSMHMQYGMIDKTGQVVVPIEYDWVWQNGWKWNFDDGLAFVVLRDYCYETQYWGSSGLMDKTGKEIVAVGYYDGIESFSEGFAQVWHGGEGENGYEMYHSGAHGFIDTTGREIVLCIFEDVRSFSEGLAAVKVDGKWGYIAIAE